MLEQYKGLRREIYVLSFGRLVTGLGSMIWPMMTLILSQKMGVGATEISWMLSAAMILMAPAIFAGGKIADRYNKKNVIICFDVISVICFGICAFIPMSWGSIFLLFIGSVFQNMEHPAYSALVADISLTSERDRAYSLQYLCANLGLVMSPTIAGFLFKNYLWLAFLINSLSVLSSTMLIFFMVRNIEPVMETTVNAVYQNERAGESLLKVILDNKVVLIFIAVMSGYYAVYQMYVYLMPLDLAVLHGDSGAIIYGSVTSLNCVVVVLFTPVITRLFGHRPEPDRLTAGTTLLVLGFVIFYFFEGVIPVYYFAMTILTIGEIFAMTSEIAYLSRRVPSSHRGQFNGVFTVVRTLLSSILQVAVGFIYGSAASSAAWLFVFAVGIGFIVLALAARRMDRAEYPDLYLEDAE